jgi:hypothetical protein
MTTVTLGTLVYTFFVDYLAGQKGLRPSSIRSYAMRCGSSCPLPQPTRENRSARCRSTI